MTNDLIDPTTALPANSDQPAVDADRELIKELAMDIGKEVVAHIETMYPAMFEAVAGTAKLSVRNCVYNEIMAALEVNDADAIRDRLEVRRKFRRKILKAYRDIRKPTDDPS